MNVMDAVRKNAVAATGLQSAPYSARTGTRGATAHISS